MWGLIKSPNTGEECAGYFVDGSLIFFVHFKHMAENHPLYDYFANEPF